MWLDHESDRVHCGWGMEGTVAVIRGLDWAVIGGSRAEKQEGE